MSSSSNKINSKYVVLGVFVVSLIVFVISVVPTAYFASGNSLVGTAGQPPNPDEPTEPLEPSTENGNSVPALDRGVSIISGIITIVSGVLGLQTTRSGFAALKAKEIDKEMQMREIEILRLELELEKQKKNREARKTRAKKK